MHGADKEDDAGRYAQCASHEHPGRTARTRRKQRAKVCAIHPEKIAAARASQCAKDKLEYPHQHHVIPDHTRHAPHKARRRMTITARTCAGHP